MLPKAPESELGQDDNPLVEALYNYQLLHVEAYVVHVDMISQNEVAFKLTPETIESLVEYHKDIYSVDTAANTWNWSEKEIQLKKLQEEFVQAANRFVYRTSATALEGMEEDGAGELLCGRSDEAKAAILGLFLPLLPPPPRIVDVVRPTPLLPSSTGPDNWWHSPIHQPHTEQVDSWKVVPSSPSTTSSSDSHQSLWAASLALNEIQVLSPAPSHSQPYSTAAYSEPQYFSAPVTTASIQQFLLPSMLAQQQCSTAASISGFGWGERYQDFALPYGTTM
ncbi:conserved hypothetical protein [Histoplasma mississippiense (nom. inval.)]|uniref:conserved hypothetical protein n=1 Tax=Ajellomyces capsulatus (strain NAm1 / WU24) TaxID=2059318 RepID=UPI000157B479|nr:conserved hypothetical protein [Histoplasma mississippiense (nom. inval.)]EDN02344.1 conserved hypothetical protein [Histoplasma mississippiense (nom. inval.)]